MNLINDFFGKIIPASLSEPTHATIEFSDKTMLEAIVVPRIDEEGRLVFDFYDARGNSDSKLAFQILALSFATVRFRNGRSIKTVLTQHKTSHVEMPSSGRLRATQSEFCVMNCPITYANFCIEDFPLFLGEGIIQKTEFSDSDSICGESSRMLGHAKFKSDGWEFTISQCPEKNELGVTHSGSIQRTDEETFSMKQLNHVINGLTYFLSFIVGVYRIPVITIGYDSNRDPASGCIARFKQSKYYKGNWFNLHSHETITTLFPGFWHCYNNHPQEIYSVIGSYAESSIIAHAGLPRNALTCSQTALEGLSLWLLGRKRETGKENTSKYIKKALDKVGIKHDLSEHPNILKLWQNHKNSEDDDDGATFITRLRNKKTHPNFKQIHSLDYFYAWNLSQRYVELILLKLFCYKHEYYDRISNKTLPIPFSSSFCSEKF